MRGTLWWYFLKNCAQAFLIVAGSLTLLLIIFDVLAEFDEVGSAGYEASDALLVVAMMVPRRIVEQSAYICMLGVFLTLANLARTHELTAIQVAGVSKGSIVIASLTAVTLVLGVLALLELSGRSMYQEALKYRAVQLSDRMNSIRGRGIWMYDDNSIVNVQSFLEGGGPQRIHIYELGADHEIDAYVFAPSASGGEQGEWQLRNGIEKRYAGGQQADFDTFSRRSWLPLTDPGEILLELPVDSLTMPQLLRQIATLRASSDDTQILEMQLWGRMALPLQGLAFSFLAAMISLGRVARGDLSRRMLIGIMLALVLYIATQLVTNLMLVLGSSPMVALLTPLLCIGAGGALFWCKQRGFFLPRQPASIKSPV